MTTTKAIRREQIQDELESPLSYAPGVQAVADNELPTKGYVDSQTAGPYAEDVSGQITGSEDHFTTVQTFIAGSLRVWVNGIYQGNTGGHFTEDVTYDGFTFNDWVPQVGEEIAVVYWVEGGGGGSQGDHALLKHLDFASSGHTGFESPSGAQTKVDTHEALTTGIHGVGASTVESAAGAQTKVDTHEALTTGVHGVGNSTVESVTGSQAKVTAHESAYDHTDIPSGDEKAALVGTDGTPSAANPYVTDSDDRLTDERDPKAHDLYGAAHTGSLGSGQHGSLADGDHTGNLTGNARVGVAKDTVSIGKRREINFVEGTGIQLTLTDKPLDESVEVVIDADGSGLDHAALDHLDFASSGHTGFEPFHPDEDSDTAFSYNVDGSIDEIEKSVGGSPTETSTFSYNLDGSINTIVTAYVGKTKTDTFAYNPDGSIDTIETVWT